MAPNLDKGRQPEKISKGEEQAVKNQIKTFFAVSLLLASTSLSDGWSWPENRSYRGRSLASGLKSAIDKGHLKPGMVIYCNNTPGADPSSMNMAYQPHWFTYLGKDSSGVPRFSDQYATDFDLSGPRGIAATYGGSRRIDAFFDPYRR